MKALLLYVGDLLPLRTSFEKRIINDNRRRHIVGYYSFFRFLSFFFLLKMPQCHQRRHSCPRLLTCRKNKKKSAENEPIPQMKTHAYVGDRLPAIKKLQNAPMPPMERLRPIRTELKKKLQNALFACHRLIKYWRLATIITPRGG